VGLQLPAFQVLLEVPEVQMDLLALEVPVD
jgi:hypothetical protein